MSLLARGTRWSFLKTYAPMTAQHSFHVLPKGITCDRIAYQGKMTFSKGLSWTTCSPILAIVACLRRVPSMTPRQNSTAFPSLSSCLPRDCWIAWGYLWILHSAILDLATWFTTNERKKDKIMGKNDTVTKDNQWTCRYTGMTFAVQKKMAVDCFSGGDLD